MTNIILDTDSYKHSHWKMYPPGTRYIGSYLESRMGAEFANTVFFGLQYIIRKHLEGRVISSSKIDEAERLVENHMGHGVFNRAGWEHILAKHDGRLPISIHAVPEGSVIPTGNVLMTVQNTDPEVPWLTSHVETLLLQVWYPCTVATISFEQYKVLRDALLESGNTEHLNFALHDFGFRGSTSRESAALGGAAHLLNFQGTDNIAGMRLAMEYYNAVRGNVGKSVPSAEHSTITAWGEDGELDAYDHILRQFPTSTVGIVSDSWDINRACREMYGDKLKREIESKAYVRRVVVRPDSGNPITSILDCLGTLAESYGYTENDRGYKVLNGNIGILQGDGISYRTLPGIVKAVMAAGWSLENVIFGSGGGLLQECNRDTQRFAIKCSWADVNGEVRDVYKAPKTDPTKNSKRGKLSLVKIPGGYRTYECGEIPQGCDNLLEPVFEDGVYTGRADFDVMKIRLYNAAWDTADCCKPEGVED